MRVKYHINDFLIEPYWNVNALIRRKVKRGNFFLIEPYWNVNIIINIIKINK